MNITIFGGTGKVGSLVVKQLLDDGHALCLLTHSSPQFDSNAAIRIVKGDVHDATAVSQAINGSGAVVSALGSWHTPTKDILSSAMRNIIPAMQAQNKTRIISLTGSGAYAPDDTLTAAGKISHAMMSLVANKIISDAEIHLQLLADSNLDWTVLRAPVMKSGAASKYYLNNTLPKAWETITRNAVAAAIIDQLTDITKLRQAPHIHQN